MISCSLWHFKRQWCSGGGGSFLLITFALFFLYPLLLSGSRHMQWFMLNLALPLLPRCRFFFFPTRKSISGQPHFPLCVSRLLMKQVKLNQRMQTVWRAKEVQGVDRIMETFHVEALWSKEVRVSKVSFILGSGLQLLSIFFKQIYLSTFVLLNLLKLWYKIWYFMWFGATSVTYTYTPNINRCTWACISQSSVQWLKVSPRFGSSSAAHFGIVPSLWSHVPVYHSLGVLRSQSR